ncbi:helix-turn-helix domain-containing protein, partial [Klebsiella pneumoniae]|uniref:helix-turn-helix domain-containing protein n=1 Tax=Klebsiella pneumoniae TaxID=573 RepID=UPI001D0D88DA
MSKPKYPFEKRLEVVNHYFTTDDGYRIISARFGVPRTQVRTWVALYEKHGEKGLIPKPKGVSADPELRIKVVKAVTEQQMSLNQAAAHFMLAGSGSVAKWLKVYEEHGEAGLRALKIGTKRNITMSVYGSTTYCNFYSHVKYSPLASSVRVIYVAFCCYTAPDIQPFF